MSNIVDVPGVGEVEFPDGMSNADMETAIKAHLASPVSVPHNEGAFGSLSAGSQGANSALAGLIGAPVDIYNKYIGKPFAEAVTGRKQEDLPGGSQTVRAGMDKAVELIKRGTGAGDPNIKATYGDISEVPEHLRPAARAGEVTGSVAGLLAPVLGAARGMSAADIAASKVASGGAIPSLWRSIVGQAAENPGGFMASQVPSTIGQAAGAYGAEALDPDSPTAQVIGQLAGGGLGGLVSAGGKQVGSGIDRIRGKTLSNLHRHPDRKRDEAARQRRIARIGPELAKHEKDLVPTILGRLNEDPIAAGT